MTSRFTLRQIRIPLVVSSWVVFAISLTLYWITCDPGASYWDCPEYVTVASKMEVGHPPGNPIWMLAMRVATIPFSPENHAYVVNLSSCFFMAFASLFLCRIIFTGGYFLLETSVRLKKNNRRISFLLIGIVAAGASLCFALCDSTWFSAVEAEVYAMSAFLSSLSLWIMALWWFERNNTTKRRLLILLAYVIGLSLGVHQLNLLLIPVYSLVILYFRKRRRIGPGRLLFALLFSVAVIGIILMGLMPGSLRWAQFFELFWVNNHGYDYNHGVIIYGVVLLVLMGGSVFLLEKFGKLIVSPIVFLFLWMSGLFFLGGNIILSLIISIGITLIIMISSRITEKEIHDSVWMLFFILLGFSSFIIIMIRSQANPSMNEAVPDNIFALSSYVGREQYSSNPLVYGSTPYSKPLLEEKYIDGVPSYSMYYLEKGNPKYHNYLSEGKLHHRSRMLSYEDSVRNERVRLAGKGYFLTDYKFSYKLTPELNMWFPRITSTDKNHMSSYSDWTGMTEETMEKVKVSEVVDTAGNYGSRREKDGNTIPAYSYRPTYSQNLQYFLTYQGYYMFLRYLLWNFVGRQNDFDSAGEIDHGNFITGIPVIDRQMIGDTDLMPDEIWNGNKGRNRYFGIPFLFGLIGILWLIGKSRDSRRILFIITLMFIMTGFAIVVYLNQTPAEPRERDYSFLGAYMAFAIWIGAGYIGIIQSFLRRKAVKTATIIGIVISLGTPTLMALENFDDHDRRGRYEPLYYASTLLDFEYPAIIFSHGDNSTFPLWYATEVLDMGKEHTPVDVTYFQGPSYVVNLQKQNRRGIETIASPGDIAFGRYLFTSIPEDFVSEPLPLSEVLKNLYASDSPNPSLETSLVIVPVSPGNSIVLNLHEFTGGGRYLNFRQLMLLDILAAQTVSDNPKVLFFPYLIGEKFYKQLEALLTPVLSGKIYAPHLPEEEKQQLLKKNIDREIEKLGKLNLRERYRAPVVNDRTVRYRGEFVMGANEMMKRGDTVTAMKIIDLIEEKIPYDEILPGTMTISDSTYYEGREFKKVLKNLYKFSGEKRYSEAEAALDSLMEVRKAQWQKYYRSLSPRQRHTLSNRSARILAY